MEERTYPLKEVRVYLEQGRTLYSKDRLDNAMSAAAVMQREMSRYDREVVCIVNMNTALQPINFNVVSMGTLNEAMVHPREVFKASILSNANSVICIHNHPGGDVTPSDPDIAVTNRLTECGKILGIEVVDHLIIGGDSGSYFSFQESSRSNMKTAGMPENERAAEKQL